MEEKNDIKNKRNKLKHYLSRYNWIKQDILLAEVEIERLNTKLYSAKGQNITGMPSGGKGLDMGDIVTTKEEAVNRLKRYIAKGENIRNELELLFDKVPDEKLRLVLRTIYIYGHRLDETADSLGYNYRYTLLLHRIAIDKILELNLVNI